MYEFGRLQQVPLLMKKTKQISWAEIMRCVKEMVPNLKKLDFENIYAIPRGGLVAGVMLSHRLDIPLIIDKSLIGGKTLLVDDIVDSGKEMKKWRARYPYLAFVSLYERYNSEIKPDLSGLEILHDYYLIFPWES